MFMVFYCFLTISEEKLRIDIVKLKKCMLLLICENFNLIICIILNQKFTSVKKFRVETATYIYLDEKIA